MVQENPSVSQRGLEVGRLQVSLLLPCLPFGSLCSQDPR